MLNPARAKRATVASCSEPLGIPSLSVRAIALRHLPEKAGPRARVADIAVAEPGHLEEHRVVVAIDEQLGHLQAIPRGLTFRPERIARSTEERRKAGRLRFLECLVIHE